PAVRGIVADQPHPLLVGAGHDVEVVVVVAGGGGQRPVVAEGHEGDVAGAHRCRGGDLTGGRGVGREQGEQIGCLGGVGSTGDRGLEVVDLLEAGLRSGDRLMVFVRGIGRPVAAGGDDLAGDDLHAVGSGRGGEGVDLTARDGRTAQFDGNLGGGHELDGARLLGRCLGDGDPSGGRRQGGTGAGRQVETVGGTVEDRGPTGQ